MKKKRFSEEQIIKVLQEQEDGSKVDAICRRHGIANSTYYKWKEQYGGMTTQEMKRLSELETENAKLKKLLAESMLDNAALKDVVSRKW